MTHTACNHEIKRLENEITSLRASIAEKDAEIERLRGALHEISLCSQNSTSSKEECGRIARAALAAKDAEIARLRSALTVCRNDYRVKASGASPIMHASPFVMLDLCEKALEEK